MADFTNAPWTDEQVEALNAHQNNRNVHPFTCGQCRDRLGIMYVEDEDGTRRPPTEEEEALNDAHSQKIIDQIDKKGNIDWEAYFKARPVKIQVDDRKLVATNEGWMCPTCDYTQNWAHASMLLDPPPGDINMQIFTHDR